MKWLVPWLIAAGIVWLIVKTVIMFRKTKEPKE